MNDGDLLIRDAHILDVHTGDYVEGDLLCRGGRVVETGPGLPEPAVDVRTVKAHGGFLIPGLVDAHVHVTAIDVDLGGNERSSPYLIGAGAARNMTNMLRRGFTTVRDVGGADHGLAEAQVRGLIIGPRLLFGGRALSQTGGHGDFRSPGDDSLPTCGHGIGRVVDGVDAVRHAARDEIRKGAHHIKIMASGGIASPTDRIDSTQFSDDEIRSAVEEAEAANRYVAAHAYTARAVNRCLEAGVRSIEHGNLIDDSSIALLLERKAFLVPNVGTYHLLARRGAEFGQDRAKAAKVEHVLDAALRSLESAHRAGVDIVFGSDLLGAMQPHQSEEFLIRAEVQPLLTILQSATTTAARLVRMEGEIGEVAVGAVGDLLLFDHDPLSRPDVLAEPDKHLTTLIQGGRVIDR